MVASERGVKLEPEPPAAAATAPGPPPPPPDVHVPPPEAEPPLGAKRKREAADFEAMEALLSARSECALTPPPPVTFAVRICRF